MASRSSSRRPAVRTAAGPPVAASIAGNAHVSVAHPWQGVIAAPEVSIGPSSVIRPAARQMVGPPAVTA